MKNTIRFVCNSLLISVMLVMSIIYFVFSHRLLVAGILTIFLSTLFIINTFLMIRYINYRINGNKHVEELVDIFCKKYFKYINETLLLIMIVTSTIAAMEFKRMIPFRYDFLIYVLIDLILIPLIAVEFTKIIDTFKEYSKLKVLFRHNNSKKLFQN